MTDTKAVERVRQAHAEAEQYRLQARAARSIYWPQTLDVQDVGAVLAALDEAQRARLTPEAARVIEVALILDLGLIGRVGAALNDQVVAAVRAYRATLAPPRRWTAEGNAVCFDGQASFHTPTAKAATLCADALEGAEPR